MSEQKWTAEPWEWDCNNIEQVGSPWKSIMEPEVLCGAWCQGGMVSLNISDADKARVIQCVNACAGIPDPAAAIREAREALMALSRLLPTDEGLGGRANITAFYRVGHQARAALRALGGDGQRKEVIE